MWIVAAEATDNEYFYLVDAPEDTEPSDVACAAYAKHGKLYRDSTVYELLGPVYTAHWQEAVTWTSV